MNNKSEQKINSAINYCINNYVLINEIDRGGHGVVYRAYNEKTPKEIVAVKIIEDTGNLDRLLVEPELLSRLNHPNIILLKDYFLHAGKLILVTEYIDGIDLETYLKQQGRLKVPEVIAFMNQIASALSYAHAKNIIHRDLKLRNIIVNKKNQLLKFILVDFGISRIAQGIQMTKHFAGTYYYMAPEQLRGRPCEQSDLWGLGVCAYMLLTGIKPFEGKTEEELIKNILYGVQQLPSSIINSIDFKLENIILHLLEKQLINRIASADDLLNDLGEITDPISLRKVERHSDSISYSTALSWEQNNLKESQKSWKRFWLFAFLSTIPFGIIGEALTIGGAILFFIGQDKRLISRTIMGILLILLGFPLAVLTYSSIGLLISIPFVILAINNLVRVRSLKKDLLLLRTMREASKNRDELIQLVKKFLDIHWGDINVHQKYIELLFLQGRIKEAIVETKLLIEIDPYNFGATLMLAHGYFEIDLFEECMQVCNNYLSISGYCFEFSDLKDKCKKFL